MILRPEEVIKIKIEADKNLEENIDILNLIETIFYLSKKLKEEQVSHIKRS